MKVSLEAIEDVWNLTMIEVRDFQVSDTFRYLSDPDLLSQWLPFAVLSLEPREGGAISIRTPDGAVAQGTITQWVDDQTVGFRVPAGSIPGPNDTVLTLSIDPNQPGSEITIVQQIPTPHVAAMVAVGWDACLVALSYLDRGEAIPQFPPEVAVFEDVIAQLGQDQPELQPIPGGTRIRFDRQTLLQPLEKVWSVMTAGVPLKEGDFAPPTFTGSSDSGRISILTPPTELEYLTADGGRVKWRFHEHFGSARINLQIAVPRAVDAEAAAALWQQHLTAVVARIIAA